MRPPTPHGSPKRVIIHLGDTTSWTHKIHMEYLYFEIEIGKGLGRGYPVAVIRSPSGGSMRKDAFSL
jgi:hypothetical protein